ncbi:MAG: hypothetical protein Q4G70_05050 [Pseudomonadota bacterium]|nr:hypothetical protein [Pseudomonadota bacterium]
MAPLSLAGDMADSVRKAWLTAKLYGNDNDGAALRPVVIQEVAPNRFSVHIQNQFGFKCDLTFDADGYPHQLSNCVSHEDGKPGGTDAWFVQEPAVIDLICSTTRKEVVCKGDYVLAKGSFKMDWTPMTIAMRRSALPRK